MRNIPLNQPVRLRRSDDELSEDEQSLHEEDGGSSEDEDNHSDDSNISDEEGSDVMSQGEDEDEVTQEGLEDISFGALAKAQALLAPPSRTKKRKRSEEDDETQAEGTDAPTTVRSAKAGKHPDSRPNQPIQRSSKHAPTVLSSKHPVSRTRQIFEPPAAQRSRDPRFDAAVKASTLNTRASEHADKNYAFLTTYQATEVLNLKAQLKKAKDPADQAAIKRQVMSLEAKIRNADTRRKERDILSAHRQQERQDIREGKKARPYFLKQSDVRQKIRKDRVDGMGKKARDKMEKRRVKKQKGKDGRDMPRVRRSMVD